MPGRDAEVYGHKEDCLMSLVNMRMLLERAERTGKGCGAFNAGNMEMVRGIIKAAEELRTPVILQIAEGRLPYSPLELMGPMMVQAAKEAKVDVAVHFDHGRSIEKIRQALEYGFTSVMFDGSSLSFDDNVACTLEIIQIAGEYNAAVEGELGVVGGNEDGGKSVEIRYTEPADAKKFCELTGVDALAVAIGNAHGNYASEPKLAFDILKQIDASTDTPLVLHGGSGITEADFKKTIIYGIRKVNIATANFNAYMSGLENYRNKTDHPDYFKQSEAAVESVCENVKKHIEIFNNPVVTGQEL